MRALYFVLPFIRTFIIDRQIIYKIPEVMIYIKNISMFDNFNALDPSLQQFMLQL